MTETHAAFVPVRARDLLSGRLRRQGAPSSVSIRTASGAAVRVATLQTPAGFGGIRIWLVCPHCGRRAERLWSGPGTIACRECAGVPYPSRKFHRTRYWQTWGRVAQLLIRVRAVLARPRLRLAHRGRLERLEKELEAALCAGLSTEITATIEWLERGAGGTLVGVSPFDEKSV